MCSSVWRNPLLLRWLSLFLLVAGPAAAQPALGGKGLADVEALLGRPDLLTRDNPAEIWQYGNTYCVLHIFFYPSGTNGAYVVEHVERRMRPAYASQPERCTLGDPPGATPAPSPQPVPETPAAPPVPVEQQDEMPAERPVSQLEAVPTSDPVAAPPPLPVRTRPPAPSPDMAPLN